MNVRDDAALVAGCRFLRSFYGLEAPDALLDAVHSGRTSGVTLFRSLNVGTPEQVRALCAALQDARPAGDPPLVIGIDQEGGQLQTVGEGATAWPGNLALGAAADPELARRAGRAIGLEARALGATLNFAPDCDLLQAESTSHLGTRAFGDDPDAVARLVSAMVEGMAETGLGTTLKHFPGAGRASGDPHAAMPVLDHDAAELRAIDLPPFRAGIAAGALAVMPGHLAAPAVTGRADVPATYSSAVLRDLLRGELGFDGVVVSDAMNMGGAAGSGGLREAALAAVEAGIDLLLMLNGDEAEADCFEALVAAAVEGRLAAADLEDARERIFRARRTFERVAQPPLDVLACPEHLALAREIAEASITLVADPAGILPLHGHSPSTAGGRGRVALIAPVPRDITPAETSSYVRLGLAEALRRRGADVDEYTMPIDPTPGEALALAYATRDHAIRIVGTIDARDFPGQAAFVRLLAEQPVPVVAVALRTPYDAALVPAPAASVCTYGIQASQMEALAGALLGEIPFAGRLPVAIGAFASAAASGGPHGAPKEAAQ